MAKRIVSCLLCVLILASVAASLCACSGSVEPSGGKAKNLIEDAHITPGVKSADALNKAYTPAVAEFALKLFKQSLNDDGNTLISPLSVICALAMTMNGARGETLAQAENVFGMDIDSLNEYLGAYISALPQGEKYKLSLANSIWFTDKNQFDVRTDFLQLNADIYGADIYKTVFDGKAVKTINNWVKGKTDGTIDRIIEDVEDDNVMFLINALAFDSEWQVIYEDESSVRDNAFTNADGTVSTVKMMFSGEGTYLDDGSATGFIKNYADAKYAFAALLPNEGVSVFDYIASMSGEKLCETLSNARASAVNVGLPKFESSFSAEMSEALKALGMSDAFDCGAADFSGIASLDSCHTLYISKVLHKTFISVGERGTRAGATTAVVMNYCTSEGPVEELKTVVLDRPFVYMIIDCETMLPIFIGVQTTMPNA